MRTGRSCRQTAATIDTPEPWVNEFLKRNAQYGEIVAQKMPDTGYYTNLTGSQMYARMWATPTTMFDTMLLDTLGYHQAVDRYLEILRDAQGTVKPPGPDVRSASGLSRRPGEPGDGELADGPRCDSSRGELSCAGDE